jgi:PAS domain S-box-containing protein
MVGMNIRQLIPPEASEIVGERTKEILEKGHKLYEAIHKRQDGSVISLELNSTAFEVGNRNYIITISRDTAERRKMEEELRLRARILDRAMDAIVVRDIEGNIVYVNEVATRVTGSSNEDMIGKNLAQFMKPEQIEQMKYRTGVLLKRGFDRHEGIRVLSDGSVIPIEINSRLFESDGRKLIISVSRDIAERKSMEEELKLKAQLLDNAFDLIFARDEEGNLVYANELACKTLGYRREEITKLKLADILSQYNRDRLTQKTQELLSVGEKEMEVLLVRKDGTQIPVEARSRVVDIDDQKYIISVSRDITQRKKIEEESKLRAHLLDNAKDSIFVYDQEGNLLYVNKEACESRGYTRDELMNMNIRNLTPQRNMTLLEKRLTEWPRQGYGLFEAVHLCKDGSEIPVEIYVRYLEIGDRKLLVSVARDITERKKIEQERHDMEQKAQFSSHLSSIGELAAGVAHEINNPLTAVVGYAQLLMQRDLPEDIIKDLSNIREGAKRVADIVSRLLTFAQRSRLERVYANINEIINTTLSLREYELKTSNIEVITKYAPDLQWTVVDVGQMQQVFLNLIINAETEMRLAHDGGKLSIITKQEDGFIRISFKDNGPGIAKENLERVFDPFFTTREVGQGTGLGLSMCHGIVKEHGGTITVKSAPGKGATFIVELPVVTEPKQLELEESESEIIDVTEQARVLVVDDEPMVGELLTEWLTSLGHKVEVVDNAKDAITMLKEKTYNVILLDIKMPGMSGIELYNYFRKEIPSLLQRIVFITGDVIGYDTQKFLSMTRAYYVTKPFDYEYFKHEINKVMAQA